MWRRVIMVTVVNARQTVSVFSVKSNSSVEENITHIEKWRTETGDLSDSIDQTTRRHIH